MSLQVWLPLTKDLRNQGLSNVTVTNNGATFNSAGKLGGCYSFGTGASSISLPISTFTSLDNKDFSVACWVKIISWNSSYSTIWATTSSSASWANIMAGLFRNGTSSQILFCIGNNSSSTQTSCITTENIELNVWYHFVCTYTLGKISLYQNGDLVSSYNTSIIPNFSTTQIVNIGKMRDNTYQSNSLINDFRIYDHCLSEKEVKEISKGLVLHYPLNNNGYGNENLAHNTCNLAPFSTSQVEYKAYDVGLLDVSNGETITISFDLDMVINTASNYLLVYNTNNKGPHQVQSVTALDDRVVSVGDHLKERVAVTTTVINRSDASRSTDVIEFYSNYSTENEIFISNIKVERGPVATPWCPNFDDLGFGNIEYDISGYCNNGTRTGNFSWTDDTPRYKVSTVFNGSNYIQSLDNTNLFGNLDFTISFWINASTFSTDYAGVIWNGCSGTNQAIAICVPSGKISLDFWNNRYLTNNTVLTNGWHHVCCIKKAGIVSASNSHIYVDGQEVAGTANNYSSVAPDITGNYKWIVARLNDTSSRYITGNISDVRVYATALSAEDILELYQQKGYANSFEGNNLIYYEYIQNNDLTQYIDLQTSLINKTVEVKFQQTPLANKLNTVYGGEDGGDPWNAYGFRFNSSTAYMYLNGNLDTTGVNNGITTPAPDENIHIFRGIHKINQKSSATLDGEALPVVETIPNKFSTRTALLFATKGLGNPGGLKNNNLDLRVYYFKIWDENDNLTHYLRPCSYNGHTGMWNEINNTFYPNCGKGEFTCGNILEEYN